VATAAVQQSNDTDSNKGCRLFQVDRNVMINFLFGFRAITTMGKKMWHCLCTKQ